MTNCHIQKSPTIGITLKPVARYIRSAAISGSYAIRDARLSPWQISVSDRDLIPSLQPNFPTWRTRSQTCKMKSIAVTWAPGKVVREVSSGPTTRLPKVRLLWTPGTHHGDKLVHELPDYSRVDL